MGKGDIKSKKGKIANGSFGKKRKQRTAKKTTVAAKAKPVKVKKAVDATAEPEVKKTKKTTKRTAKKTDEGTDA
jgi:30S ribosomal protein S31